MATTKIYGGVLAQLLGGNIDWLGSPARCMLATTSYVPNQDTHQFRSSVTNEASGTGYTAGGVLLSGKTSAYDAGTNTQSINCASITLTGATITFRYLIFYMDTGSAATDPLICYVDYGSTQTATAQNVNLITPVAGLVQFTVAA